jgi:hypothetical protein
MRRERLHLSRYTSIETYRDWNGRVFIAYSSSASMLFRDVTALRKWLKLPKGVASRDTFDSWIASIEAADQERADKKKPLLQEGLSDELLATGFGPEVHLDESDPMDDLRQASADVSGVEVHLDKSDPNYQTRTVI